MGVAAVPGSGKTWTLSVLASNLIADGFLAEGQEVLVVTLVNSAVNNFSQADRRVHRAARAAAPGRLPGAHPARPGS